MTSKKSANVANIYTHNKLRSSVKSLWNETKKQKISESYDSYHRLLILFKK